MAELFPNAPPPKLSVEEKRQVARRFRRAANRTDACGLLGFALILLASLADLPFAGFFLAAGFLLIAAFCLGCVSTYHRCPACGNRILRGEYGRYLGPFTWRGYECPVCYFTPDWSK